MATLQPTLFDLGTPAGFACLKPSRRKPGAPRTGTYAGYIYHRSVGEKPCPPCLEATRLRTVEYRKKNKDKVFAQRKEYRERNRESIAAEMRKHYLANREERIEYVRNYQAANPEKNRQWRREIDSRRRVRFLSLPTDGYTLSDVTEAYGTICYLCSHEVNLELKRGFPESPEIDHVHPVSRPGCPGDVLENCRWVHAACNRRKSARLISELDLPFPAP